MPAPSLKVLAQAANLGLTGMKVCRCADASEPTLPERTPLQVAFELPDGGTLVEVSAEVVFDRPQGRDPRFRATGLRFGTLSPDIDARLRRFLKGFDAF